MDFIKTIDKIIQYVVIRSFLLFIYEFFQILIFFGLRTHRYWIWLLLYIALEWNLDIMDFTFISISKSWWIDWTHHCIYFCLHFLLNTLFFLSLLLLFFSFLLLFSRLLIFIVFLFIFFLLFLSSHSLLLH